MDRGLIVAEARAWLGTPFVHQASAKGAGCDCLGLVRGVWRELVGPEPEPLPPYAPDWAARGPGPELTDALGRWLTPTPLTCAAPGDVLVFRMAPGAPARHAAILVPGPALIHAYWGRAVVESRFAPWWARRCAGAFAFPGADPWPN